MADPAQGNGDGEIVVMPDGSSTGERDFVLSDAVSRSVSVRFLLSSCDGLKSLESGGVMLVGVGIRSGGSQGG
jgi:hypothetical protein